METLHALGVQEVLLVGLCGGFAPQLSVGDVLLPEQLWSEGGTSLHYRQAEGFGDVPSVQGKALGLCLEGAGFPVRRLPPVSTDAPHREPFWEEGRGGGVEDYSRGAACFCAVSGRRVPYAPGRSCLSGKKGGRVGFAVVGYAENSWIYC